jgi:hypothetical protein
VSSFISSYKSNSYGQKSITVVVSAYDIFGKPFVPLLAGPYAYVKPYFERADDLADHGLDTVDAHFPLVKEEPEKVRATAIAYATFPLRLAGQGKTYVVGTFNDEYSKTGGQGVFRLVQATISTELKLGLDAYNLARSLLFKAEEKVQEKRQEKANN